MTPKSKEELRKGIIGNLSRIQLYAKDHPYTVTASDEADIEHAADEILALFKQYAQPPAVADEEIDEILFDYELEVSSIEKKLRKGSLIPQEAEKRIAEQQTEAKAALLQREQRLVAEADDRAHLVGFKNGKWAMTKRVNDIWLQIMTNEVGYKKAKAYQEAVAAQLRHNTNTGKEE